MALFKVFFTFSESPDRQKCSPACISACRQARNTNFVSFLQYFEHAQVIASAFKRIRGHYWPLLKRFDLFRELASAKKWSTACICSACRQARNTNLVSIYSILSMLSPLLVFFKRIRGHIWPLLKRFDLFRELASAKNVSGVYFCLQTSQKH